jgi:hypothetical protein
MARIHGDGPQSGQNPHWDELLPMIDELAAARDHYKRDGTISYRQLSKAIGRSPTILYGIMDRYHKPTSGTLADLADYAARHIHMGEKDYPPIPHLAPRSVWLRAGDLIRSSEPAEVAKLTPTQRKILAMVENVPEEEMPRFMSLINAVYQSVAKKGPDTDRQK